MPGDSKAVCASHNTHHLSCVCPQSALTCTAPNKCGLGGDAWQKLASTAWQILISAFFLNISPPRAPEGHRILQGYIRPQKLRTSNESCKRSTHQVTSPAHMLHCTHLQKSRVSRSLTKDPSTRRKKRSSTSHARGMTRNFILHCDTPLSSKSLSYSTACKVHQSYWHQGCKTTVDGSLHDLRFGS
eukprot:1137790-Pelagomonas_calceolata.AAC.1